ncbi:hypothetical protein L5515_017574 [Caenorhabditis briggsae]|uniref:Uncharacterized protein n=1 Tax=Caenorhabditis briggsae TaxID=6238 RepID=A0AAE9FE44_CAEBR|nr:hypothetical protein L5515_017574 [Caenorhabditis briggsae]
MGSTKKNRQAEYGSRDSNTPKVMRTANIFFQDTQFCGMHNSGRVYTDSSQNLLKNGAWLQTRIVLCS